MLRTVLAATTALTFWPRLSLLVIDFCNWGGFARSVVDRPGVRGLFSSEQDLTSAATGTTSLTATECRWTT